MGSNAEPGQTFIDALVALADLFEALETDIQARSVFSRSIAHRKLRVQTGRSLEEWRHLIQVMLGLSSAASPLPVLERWPQFRLSLARLDDYFRSQSFSEAVEALAPARRVTRVIIALEDTD